MSTTAATTEDGAQPLDVEVEKKVRRGIYKVLARLDGDPEDLYRLVDSEVEATGPGDARRQIIERSQNVQDAVEREEIVLVAIAERFWSEKRPALEKQITLDA